MVTETNIATAVPKPAFNPKTLINNENPSSAVDGIVNSDSENFFRYGKFYNGC